jgi:hypothetical protein
MPCQRWLMSAAPAGPAHIAAAAIYPPQTHHQHSSRHVCTAMSPPHPSSIAPTQSRHSPLQATPMWLWQLQLLHIPSPQTTTGTSSRLLTCSCPSSSLTDPATSHVLPLSPGLSPPRTAFDLVLPPPEAFCLLNVTQPQYPAFAASNSNWQAIFGLIWQPAFLWQCWGPGSLSDYPNIKTLWQAWDEGEVVCGVGRRPPLRSVEKEWGAKVDQRTNKGWLQSWWPHRDAAVRSLGVPLHSC